MTLKKLTQTICFLLFSIFITHSAYAKDKYNYLTFGSDKAPVTIYEIYSLACPHCADFMKDTIPLIQKNYVDKDLVKLVLVDAPQPYEFIMNAHSIIHQIQDKDLAHNFILTIMSQQSEWFAADDKDGFVIKYAKLAGLTDSQINAAIKDTKLHDWINDDMKKFFKTFKIQGTPSMVITKSKNSPFDPKNTVVQGAFPYENIKAQIEKVLNKK